MLTPAQRRWRADKLGDLANYAITALLIGQFIAQDFRFDLTLIGLLILVLSFVYSNSLLRFPRPTLPEEPDPHEPDPDDSDRQAVLVKRK